MPINSKTIVYAHVVLRATKGKSMPADAQITAETLSSVRPSDDDVRVARHYFECHGFATQELMGISFEINGSVELFEAFFHTSLREGQNGTILSRSGEAVEEYELPRSVLSGDIEPMIHAITLSPPPQFGPGEFFF